MWWQSGDITHPFLNTVCENQTNIQLVAVGNAGKCQWEMQAKNGFCPVTTLSDRGTRKASAQQDAKSFFHHKPSHHTWQSDAFSHHNTDCGLDFCPNPLCSGVQGVGATTLPMSCFLAGKGTHSQEVHLLYASKKKSPTYTETLLCSLLWLWVLPQHCPSQLLPSCCPRGWGTFSSDGAEPVWNAAHCSQAQGTHQGFRRSPWDFLSWKEKHSLNSLLGLLLCLKGK